ncbi:unnamed protein product [Nippostrongylus brasiliensis]|uniref:Apple domain-containing protein n=1 Tax=Nippostrongylus brasiliensis TaxID=27835 RepID=A0A0N4XQ06_NIPBR|nr:unnamed protein product [Nippostrongylus brasiliensis]
MCFRAQPRQQRNIAGFRSSEMSRVVLLAVLLLRCAATFVLVPYIQIDYAHYVHLAQCQAKCTEKYGVLNKRNLLDGSTEEYFDVHNTDYQESPFRRCRLAVGQVRS